jgi:hypothetical protein
MQEVDIVIYLRDQPIQLLHFLTKCFGTTELALLPHLQLGIGFAMFCLSVTAQSSAFTI